MSTAGRPCRATFSILLLLALAAPARHAQARPSGGQTIHGPTTAVSPSEVFRRVLPSVMAVESLDAKGVVIRSGSGVVIAPGRVVTNRHVIEHGTSFRVRHGAKAWPAMLAKVDSDRDLAELSAGGLRAPAARVRNSAKLALGEKVYAIGAPEGVGLAVSEGQVSALPDFGEGPVIQTSAAIPQGSSGGGLFDAQGRLVGVTTFYVQEGQGLNFALPAEWALALDRQPGPKAATRDVATFQALVWCEAAYRANEAGNHGGEVNAYQQAIRFKPDLAALWSNLGAAYQSLGQYEQAISAIQQAIRLKPELSAAWVNLGHTYGSLGQYEREIEAEKEAIRLSPDTPEAWENLCDAYVSLGQYDLAVSAFQEIVRLKPDDPWMWANLGNAYGQLGQYDKEISAEQQAIRLKSDDEQAWYSLGTAYSRLGRYDQAISALREATRLQPGLVRAWYHLGWAYEQQNKRSEAMAVYEKLKSLDAKLADRFFKTVVLP